MFTGIIQSIATIKSWLPQKEGGKLIVETTKPLSDIQIGESIAVNGCCLTVVTQKGKALEFDVSDETVRKTAFQEYKVGNQVNLERAMQAKDRFGGHFVLGHVDCVGEIKEVKEHKGSVEYQIKFGKKFSALLIEKGSVTVDGISLTVVNLKKNLFSVFIIPHTIKETNLGSRKKGDLVNLEFDVLGKYTQRVFHKG